MTAHKDQAETLIEQTLTRRADEAPADDALLTAVHGRLRRRRTVRTIGAAVLTSVTVAAVLFGVTTLTTEAPVPAPDPPAVAADPWRWEGYRGIEVQVPSSWGYTGDGSDACLRQKAKPAVVRYPVITTAQYCGEIAKPEFRAATLMLGTEGKAGVRRYDHGWAKETRIVAGVSVAVFSDDPALRTRILRSARVVSGLDGNGCTPQHPAARRPSGAGGLVAVGTVESVSVCSHKPAMATGKTLYMSRRLTGEAAAGLVEAILAAPQGSGPNEGGECGLDARGDRMFALVVHGSIRDQEVHVRFAGSCDNGTDDGTTERRLTAGVLRPLLTGPDEIGAMSGIVAALLDPNATKMPTR